MRGPGRDRQARTGSRPPRASVLSVQWLVVLPWCVGLSATQPVGIMQEPGPAARDRVQRK